MIGTIVAKEIREKLFGQEFVALLLIFVPLMLASTYVMHSNYARRMDAFSSGDETSRTNRPEVLSIFARGLDAYHDEDRASNPQFDELDVPDPAYVIRAILSLVAILLGAVAITSERQVGTLKLMLANRLPRDQVLLGKAVSNFILILAAFLIGLMLSLVLCLLSPYVSLTGDDWVRMAFFASVSLLYLFVFHNMGLLISCSTRSPATSCAVALMVWICIVLALPSLTTTLSKQNLRIYSPQEIAAQRRAIRRATMRFDETGTQVVRDREKRNVLLGKLQEQIRNQVRGLTYFTRSISRITPSASYLFCVTSISGTGVRDYFVHEDTPGAPRLSFSESLAEAFVDLAALFVWWVLFFSGAYRKFRRYDVA